jgi:hypothetical protein
MPLAMRTSGERIQPSGQAPHTGAASACCHHRSTPHSLQTACPPAARRSRRHSSTPVQPLRRRGSQQAPQRPQRPLSDSTARTRLRNSRPAVFARGKNKTQTAKTPRCVALSYAANQEAGSVWDSVHLKFKPSVGQLKQSTNNQISCSGSDFLTQGIVQDSRCAPITNSHRMDFKMLTGLGTGSPAGVTKIEIEAHLRSSRVRDI